MKRLVASFTALVALVISSAASAAPLTIASYDVTATPASGFGGWAHVYTGTITDTGRSIPGPGQPGGSGGCPCRIVNETGGSGTLNDGVFSAEITSTHLFTYRDDADGQPISPVITLHLAETSTVDRIDLYGGYIGGNIFPGAIVSATVEIAGQAVNLTTISGDDATLDTLDLIGTGLESIPTDTVILRDVRAEFSGFSLDQFSITEIVVASTSGDTEPPQIIPPADIVVDATSSEGAVVAFALTATDDRDGAVPVTCSPPSGSLFPIGTTEVACIATDAAGNSAAASFFVSVRGPGEQLDALRAAVVALDAGARVIRSLTGILDEAQDALAKGKSKQAAARLDKFIAAVGDSRDRGALTADQAEALITDARAILAGL